LVKEYFESQERFVAATKKKEDKNSNGTGNKNSAHKKNENPTKNSNNRSINYDDDYYRHEQERKNTIANPYYANIYIGGFWIFHLV